MKTHPVTLAMVTLLVSGGLAMAQQMQSDSLGSPSQKPNQSTSPTTAEPIAPAPGSSTSGVNLQKKTGASGSSTTGVGASAEKPVGGANAGTVGDDDKTPGGLTRD